jgi:hypothetical protein
MRSAPPSRTSATSTRLLENILVAAKTITHADGGTLYRVTEDEASLRFEIMRNDSLKIAMGGTSGNPIPFPPLPLRTESGEENNSMVAAYAAIHQKTVNIADAYQAEVFDFSGTRKFDERTGYRSQSFLTVPMKNHENAVIGVLQLINAIDPDTERCVAFSDGRPALAESLASQAAIALTNRQLITSWKAVRILHPTSSTWRSTRSRPIPAATASACRYSP